MAVGVIILILNIRSCVQFMDRGGNYKYLNGKLKLDEFEQKDSPHIFYEEWLRKNNIC